MSNPKEQKPCVVVASSDKERCKAVADTIEAQGVYDVLPFSDTVQAIQFIRDQFAERMRRPTNTPIASIVIDLPHLSSLNLDQLGIQLADMSRINRELQVFSIAGSCFEETKAYRTTSITISDSDWPKALEKIAKEFSKLSLQRKG